VSEEEGYYWVRIWRDWYVKMGPPGYVNPRPYPDTERRIPEVESDGWYTIYPPI
jgi:hypothetical protein